MNITKLISVLISVVICNADNILLEDNNFIHLKGEINSHSSSKFILDLNKNENNDIIIYIDSNGGYVNHGQEIIGAIENTVDGGKNVFCIADRAYSMGFIIFQSCPYRYVTKNSVLMQHPMHIPSLSGSLQTVINQLELIKKENSELITFQSNRLEMEEEEFVKRVSHEWWISGYDNLKFKAADEIITVNCSKELYETEKKTIITNGFLQTKEVVKCPLIKDDNNF